MAACGALREQRARKLPENSTAILIRSNQCHFLLSKVQNDAAENISIDTDGFCGSMHITIGAASADQWDLMTPWASTTWQPWCGLFMLGYRALIVSQKACMKD